MGGIRGVIILGVEKVALALIDDRGTDLKAGGERKPCSKVHLTVSYDGGLFKPVPNSK